MSYSPIRHAKLYSIPDTLLTFGRGSDALDRATDGHAMPSSATWSLTFVAEQRVSFRPDLRYRASRFTDVNFHAPMRFFSSLLASTLGALLALGILFFFGFLFIIALAASSTEPAPSVRANSVLTIELRGSIAEVTADDPFAEVLGAPKTYDLLDYKSALRKASADDRIAAVWLKMRGISPQWAMLEEVRRSLVEFKESGKPIYASSDDYMVAEADFFLASVADSIFAAPEAIVEFNGFYMNAEFYKKLLDKLEIEPQIIRAGKYKSAVEPFSREDLSAESREQLSALLETQSQRFTEAVTEYRSMDAASLRALLQRQAITTAREAYDTGLIDGLYYGDQVEARIAERIGLDADASLRTISFANYRNVSSEEVGLMVNEDAGEIAIVYADGTINTGTSGINPNPLFGGQMIGAETFIDAMESARTRSSVKAVVVRINSPGGFAPAADAMLRAVELTQAEKPVIVSMGSMAASGGYWMAATADTIVANPMTLTGSIGVFSVFFDVGDMFSEKLGITYDDVQSTPFADMYSGLRPLSERERTQLAASNEQTYQHFLKLVAEGRGMTTDEVDAIAQGRVWSGQDALAVGLVDVLGGLDTAVRIAAEKADMGEGPWRTRILPRPKTTLEQLTETLQARATDMWYRATTSPTERSIYRQVNTIRRLMQDHGTVQARLPFTVTIE